MLMESTIQAPPAPSSVRSPRAMVRHGWSPYRLGLGIALAGLGMLATWGAWSNMLHIAMVDEEASHFFLVPFVVAWLVWVRRGRLRLCQPRGMWVGPVIVVIGWAISMFGFYYSAESMYHGGAVIVVVGCFLSAIGSDVLVRFFPAFVVLVFLVPVPGRIRQKVAIPMQTATAAVTQNLFEVMGMPVERSGNQLRINNEDVEVAEACNGMRMVFALVMVSYAFAFGEPLRNYVRLLVLIASPISAIVCNVIRMLPTLLLFGYGSKSVAQTFHTVAGWVMLGVAFLLLMGILRVLRWALLPVGDYNLASD